MNEKIEAICRRWARELSQDLKRSLEKALKDGQPKRNTPQEAALTFSEIVDVSGGSINIQVLASGEYWVNIEDGRKPNSTPPPSDAVGKRWQNAHNIDARKVLAEIHLKHTGGLNIRKKSLGKKTKAKISYDTAAKRLAFILARSIGKKGIEPKPFVDRVITNERVNLLMTELSEVIGKEITANLELNNEYRNIKISI